MNVSVDLIEENVIHINGGIRINGDVSVIILNTLILKSLVLLGTHTWLVISY